MNRRGQALIEFVLILPIFILILFIIVDFGIIFSNKCSLENISIDIVDLINDGEEIDTIKNKYSLKSINIDVDDDGYKVITISKDVKIFSFGLKKILPNPYLISIERYIPNE